MASAEKETSLRDQEIDSMGRYLQWIGQFPLLSAEQEVELAQRIELGRMAMVELKQMSDDEQVAASNRELHSEVEQGQAARRDLTTANLRLVVSRAKRFFIPGAEQMDVIQLGNDGLIEAVDTFNWRLHYKFSTFGTVKIDSAIKDAPIGVFSIPRSQVGKHKRVVEATYQLQAILGRAPNAAELADTTGYTEGEIKSYSSWATILTPTLDETDGELLEIATYDNYDDASMSPAKLSLIISQALDELSERQKDMIVSYFGLNGAEPLKMKEIGRGYGISESEVSYVIKRAKARLKSGKFALELSEQASLLS